MKLRRAKSKYTGIKKNAQILKDQILENFSEEKIYKKFADSVCSVLDETETTPNAGLDSVVVL